MQKVGNRCSTQYTASEWSVGYLGILHAVAVKGRFPQRLDLAQFVDLADLADLVAVKVKDVQVWELTEHLTTHRRLHWTTPSLVPKTAPLLKWSSGEARQGRSQRGGTWVNVSPRQK